MTDQSTSREYISVLLPFYHDRETLGTAVHSILDQSYPYFELLLLDDGSTDGSHEIAEHFTDPRVRVHRFPHRGLTKTLNEGLTLAQYAIVARMDADDIAVRSRFEQQLQLLRTSSKQTFVSCFYGVFTGSSLAYIVRTPTDSASIKHGLLLHSYLSHPGLMFYRETLAGLGGYVNDAEIDAFQDYETWLKYKEKIEFLIMPQVLMLHRYRRQSLSNNLVYKQRVMYSIQQTYYDDLEHSFGITSKEEQTIHKGWREYFFGDKNRAREFWMQRNVLSKWTVSVLAACLFTVLPEHSFRRVKEFRLRYRIWYLAHYYRRENRELRQALSAYGRAGESR